VIENVFAHAVQQLSHLPSEKQRLNGTALKEELCYTRTPVCVDVMYVNAVAGPPLKANVSASEAKPARPNAEKRAEIEKKKKPVLTPEQKAEKAEKARIRRERAAWEKGFKKDAKFWQHAQKCVVCRSVVKDMAIQLQGKLSAGERKPVQAALSEFQPCVDLVELVDFEEQFFGASQEMVFEACEAWLGDMEDGILIEEAVNQAVKGLMTLPVDKRQLNAAALQHKLCVQGTEGCEELSEDNFSSSDDFDDEL